MSIAKKLVGQTAAYGLSSIVGRVLNFLLVPLYTEILAPGEYGIVTYLYAFVALFNVLYTYGMETAFFRFANKPDADKRAIYNSVLTLVGCTSLLFSGILILASGPIATYIGYPDRQEFVIWLALVLAIDAFATIPFAWLRLQDKALKFASIKVINIVFTVAANYFFLVICRDIYNGEYLQGLRPFITRIYDPGFGVGYIFLINLVANALLLPMLWKELRLFRFRFDPELLRPMWHYAYPLLFMGLAGMVNEVIDRILLKHWLPEGFYPHLTNEDAVGIYGACYKLSIFMSLVIQAFRYAAEPFFFSQASDKQSPQTFALIMKWFVVACAFIFLFISAFRYEFGLLLLRDPSYREGLMVVPILLMANLFLGVYYNLSIWFKLTDKTRFGTYISFGGAGITILLNLLLIPVLGYMGSAWATLACYFSMALASYLLGQGHYPIPYPVKAISFYLAIAVALVLAAIYVPFENTWHSYAFRLGLCGFLAVVVLWRERLYFFNR